MKFSSIEIKKDVIYQDLNGEVVLLNLETEKYFGLNEVGVSFWKLALEHADVSEIIAKLHDVYDINTKQLTEDINALIDNLVEQGIVTAHTV